MRRRRRYVYCLPLVLFAGLALGMWWQSRGPGNAIPTRNSPAVAKLRDAVRGANVVIVVIDAARADRIGCYGYSRDTTPSIDALAEGALLFENHFCQMPLTAASTVSLFRSQYPDTHGVYYRAEEENRPSFTLASALAGQGFRTALFSSNPSASPAVGVGLDFQEKVHRVYPVTAGGQFAPEGLLVGFRTWLAAHEGSRLFAYIHFLPPHRPYHSPPEHSQRIAEQALPGSIVEACTPMEFEFPIDDIPSDPEPPPLPEWLDLYDANLAYADWAVGQVIESLAEVGVLDTTLLIVTSDHGEAFGEHGFIWHAHAIHDEATRIPLVVRFPGSEIAARRITCLTRTIDIAPTLCDLLEIPYPVNAVQGRSLLPMLAGEAEEAAAYSVAKSYQPRKYMIRDRRYALLVYQNPEWSALYDTESDPMQRRDILGERPEVAEALRRTFRAFCEAQRHPPRSFLDPSAEPLPEPRPSESDLAPDVRDRLEALGYID